MVQKPFVIVINGSINSGKTTVSRALCQNLARTAHVEVDALRDFLFWMPLQEAIPYNLENAILVSTHFLQRGLNVVLSYPLSSEDYCRLTEAFSAYSVYCFTLCPPLEVAIQNRGTRTLSQHEVERIHVHYTTGIAFPDFGERINNASLSPQQTAERIVQQIRALQSRECGAHAQKGKIGETKTADNAPSKNEILDTVKQPRDREDDRMYEKNIMQEES